jgi:cytochrome c553
VLAEQVCSNCHGLDGNSISPQFPKLAGQQKDYIEAQLKYFRSKNRSDPAGYEFMWGIARHLTDGQIKELAEYFSQQKDKPGEPGDPTLTAKGKSIFENGIADEGVAACQGCHGPDAMGNGTFPRLADQHADYMRKQLHVLKDTDERPAGEIMKPLVHGLKPADVLAVTTYLKGIVPTEK